MKKVIMFDYDGVIVDSLESFCAAAIEGFRAVRLDQYANTESILAFHEGNWFDGMAAAGIPPETAAALEDHIAATVEGNESLRPFKGIPEALSIVAQESQLIIITSSRERVVRSFLKLYNITGISEVIGSDEETSKVTKIGLVKAQYGVEREYWYVGDTVGDILEGRSAGVRTLAVTWGWHDAERLLEARPDRLVSDTEELVSVLGE